MTEPQADSDEIVVVLVPDGDDGRGGGKGAHYGMAAAARRWAHVAHYKKAEVTANYRG